MAYNKCMIFDLDGVLMDSRELHYLALNEAIDKVTNSIEFMSVPKVDYRINWGEHLSTYDGLPTKKKLELLTKNKGLAPNLYDAIYEAKQKATRDIIQKMKPSVDLIALMYAVQINGYKIAVASNSIRDTVKIALCSLGIMPYVDYFVSNEDVKYSKPYPEMYWECMKACNAIPATTIIIEDSHIGRQGAIDSGAQLLPVRNPEDLTVALVLTAINEKDSGSKSKTVPWRNKKMNVLIPMAGAGSRFQAAGFLFPKPLIEVNGKPMIQVVVENLNMDAHLIFIVQKEHFEKYNLQYMLNLIAPGCDIVVVDGLTEGAACTTLLAKHLINNENPLVIANSDQYVEWNSNEVMYSFSADSIDGGILVFTSAHPKWSYAKLNEDGFVTEVAEKKVISDNATVGIYYWRKGSDYVKYAEEMIAKDIRVNNEFYVAPVFNEAIADGKKIKINKINKMWGIGDPESLNFFLTHKKE